MAERWWDPAGPAVDLLTPGGDRQLDIANALVAVHRCGAAAILDAASTPLCDVYRVNDALECARAAYAEPISKALTGALGDANYARLLVEDIAKEAHAAAVQIFQSAVGKGIAPSVAAHRAAAVYAVPARDMGTYSKWALNPATKNEMITDASDAVLFTWVHKAAASEVESVAKAAETIERRHDLQATEPRDRQGRYAGAEQDQSVLDALELQFMEPAKTTKQPKRLQDLRKVRRPRRVRRVQRVEQPAAAPVAQRKVRLTPVQRRKIARATPKLQQILAEQALTTVQVNEAPAGLGNMIDIDGPVRDPRLDHDVTFTMSSGRWSQLYWASFQDANARWNLGPDRGFIDGETLISAKQLTRGSDNNAAVAGTEQHEESIRLARDIGRVEAEAPSDLRPVHEELTFDEMDVISSAMMHGDPMATLDTMDKVKAQALRRLFKENSIHGVQPNNELSNTHLLPDVNDPSQWLVVWQPPNPDDPQTSRELPMVVEVTVDSDGLHGEYDPGTRGGESSVRLDPNQLIQVNGPDRDLSIPKISYDPLKGVRRIQLQGRVVNPGRSSKATETLERRHDLATAERRDPGTGRFAALDLSDHSIQAWLEGEKRKIRSAPPAARKVRRVRRVTRATATPAPVKPIATKAPAQRVVEQTPVTRRQVQAATRSIALNRASKDATALPLTDDATYYVMGGEQSRSGRNLDVRSVLGISEHAWDHDLSRDQAMALYSAPMYQGDAVGAMIKAGEHARAAGISGKIQMRGEYPATEMGREQFLADYEHKVGVMHTGGALGAAEVRLRRIRKDGQLRITAVVRDITDYSTGGIHVFRDESVGNQVSVSWAKQYRLKSRAAERAEVDGLWTELSTMGENYNETNDIVENPKVDLWTVTDTPPAGPAGNRGLPER